MPRLHSWSALAAALRSCRVIASAPKSIAINSSRSLLASSSRSFSLMASSRTSALRPTSISLLTPLSASPILQQLRFKAYGAEYQPSQRKRKRKHGFLSRLKGGKLGLSILRRRRHLGRRFLSH